MTPSQFVQIVVCCNPNINVFFAFDIMTSNFSQVVVYHYAAYKDSHYYRPNVTRHKLDQSVNKSEIFNIV